MDAAWFMYSVIVLLGAMTAASVGVMLWTLVGQRRWLLASVGFCCYTLEQAIIFFGEYVGDKPYYIEYFNHGLAWPAISIPLCAAVVTILWTWMAMRVYAPVRRRYVVVFAVAFGLLELVVAPIGDLSSVTRNMLYWGVRDLAFIGANVFTWWWVRNRATEAQRADLERARGVWHALVAFSLCILAEDITFIEFLRFDAEKGSVAYSLFWHLTERNISENIAMLYCAWNLVKEARDVMRVFSLHPAPTANEKGDAAHEDSRADLVVRLARFCDEQGLSDREKEVLALAIDGKTTPQIAQELYISQGTVKAHLHRIYTKAGVASRKDLITAFWKF